MRTEGGGWVVLNMERSKIEGIKAGNMVRFGSRAIVSWVSIGS